MTALAGRPPMTFIVTTNRDRATAFYRDTLGLPLVSEDPFAAVFDLGGVPLRLSNVESHTPSAHTVLGWQCDNIEASVRTLAERGVKFEVYEGFGQDALGIWSAPGGGAKVAWFLDPDGNNLSLTQS